MTFGKEEFVEFREDFKKAVEELEHKYDVSISLEEITYVDNMYTASMTMKDISYYAKQYKENAENYHLKQEWLGKDIVINGVTYTILGMDPTRAFYSIFARDKSTGKRGFFVSSASLKEKLK